MMLKDNVDLLTGLSKNQSVVLNDVKLKPGVRVTFVIDPDRGGGVHVVDACDVEALVMQHENKPWRLLQQHPPLPCGHFPLKLCGTHKMKCRYTIKFQEIPYKIHQFPVVPRFAQTGHSAQGMSKPNGIVMGVPKREHRFGRSGWVYVVLTRPPALEHFYMMAPLSENMDDWKPRTEVKEHIAHLERLALSTVARVDTLLGRKTTRPPPRSKGIVQ
jgi:hypothetical protein